MPCIVVVSGHTWVSQKYNSHVSVSFVVIGITRDSLIVFYGASKSCTASSLTELSPILFPTLSALGNKYKYKKFNVHCDHTSGMMNFINLFQD